MLAEGVVGTEDRALGEGQTHEVHLTPNGALAVAQAASSHGHSTERGRVFRGQTAVTGVAPGTAIGTTAAFALYNPLGSGINLVVLRAMMGYVSGTLGAGAVYYCANTVPQADEVTGTAIVPVNALLGSGIASGAKAYTTATLPANPTPIGPMFSLQASLATTAVAPWQIDDNVDGRIIVAPGACLSLEAVAGAGTTPLVTYGMVWEELLA